MDILGRGPLPVGGFVWQPRRDGWVATVVCKATFTLAPKVCAVALAQEPLHDVEQHDGGNPAKSLRAPCDLVPVKPLVDVLLVGSVFAPGGRPVSAIVARLSVGDLSKTIEIRAATTRAPDGSMHQREPFAAMPLAYERAGGGPGTANPVGLRADARGAQGGVELPNLQRPGGGLFEPVGFGPIAAEWPERRDKLGPHAAQFSQDSVRRGPLPEGIDLSYFNAAPRDQQLRALSLSQAIVLENLHAEHALLSTSLPGLAPTAVLEGRAAGPQSIALRPDTLWIDTDRGLCTLTFRGSIGLDSAAEAARIVVTSEAFGKPAAAPATRPKLADFTADIPLEYRRPGAALPFGGRPAFTAPRDVEVPAVESVWGRGAPPPPAPAPESAPAPPRLLTPVGSALEASDTAARGLATIGARAAAAPRISHAPATAPTTSAAADPSEGVDLVWFDAEAVPRIRRQPAHRPWLDALEQRPPDPDLDDPAAAQDPMILEDRRDVFEILARGAAATIDELRAAYRRALRPDGKFVPGIVVVAGELETPFDDVAELEATIALASMVAGQDDGIREALDLAREVVRAAGGKPPPGTAGSLTERIDQAVAKSKRVTMSIASQREIALVEERKVQRRSVFGGNHLRALLTLATAPGARGAAGAHPMPVYVSDEIVDALPLSKRFRARLIGELRPPVDARDGAPFALRGLALARVFVP